MLCKLKSCPKCLGDLILDVDDWRCWQCGRYYYLKPPPINLPPDPVASGLPLALAGGIAASNLHRHRRAARDINSVISAKDRSEIRWWKRNQEVIRCLDDGRTVGGIAKVTGRSQRQIRIIRERLNDTRASSPDLSLTG